MLRCLRQGTERIGEVKRLSTILLAEFFAILSQHQRGVQISRGRHTQRVLQQDLPGRVVCQILSTHHVCDALCGIINHHRKLICPQSICTLQNEVSHRRFHMLLLCSETPVMPLDDAVLRDACLCHG